MLSLHLRLKQLEQEVVGGEQARNKELQQKHRQRKNLADQRKAHLIRALSENSEESENVLLNVYNSIQEEVHAKSQMLLKVQGKVGRVIGLEQYDENLPKLLIKFLSCPELADVGYIFAQQCLSMMYTDQGSGCAIQNTTEVNVCTAAKILQGNVKSKLQGV